AKAAAVQSSIQDATKKLVDAGFTKADNPDLTSGVAEAVKMAKEKDPQGTLRSALAEANRYKEQMKQRSAEPDLLDLWLPALADTHYGRGRPIFSAGRYGQAEKEFREAIQYHNEDARYYYFYALANWYQGQREQAVEAARKGYNLERASKPASAAVNVALEKV